MNSISSKLYDPVKDRRYGILFLSTVIIFVGLSAVAMIAQGIVDHLELEKSDLKDYFLRVLPGIILLIGVLIWKMVHPSQRPQKKIFQRHELSRDEIIKARSKLVKTKN